MSEWVKVATLQDIPNETGLEVVVGDQIVALFRDAGEIVALDGVCPHSGGPLAKGCVQGQIVTCPWHGWQFNIRTGQHCLNANLWQPTIKVRVENNDVLVEVPRT